MERERRREAEWGDTEGKDEEFRTGGGGLNGKAQANTDRPLLSHHCHYFVIMGVGASLHVLLITDKGLGDVRANTKSLNRDSETLAVRRDALVMLCHFLFTAQSCDNKHEYFAFRSKEFL